MRLVVYRPSARALGAIAVLGAWAGSLGWLGARELGTDEAGTLSREAGLRLAPIGAWYAVYDGQVPVGNASVTLDTLSPGFRIVETETLETPDNGGLVRAMWRTETRLGPALGLETLHAKYSRPGRLIDWSIAADADSMTAHSATARGKAMGKARLPLSPTAGAAVSFRLAMAGSLAPGRARTLLVVDGWPIAARQAAIGVGKDSTMTYSDSSTVDPATGQRTPVAAEAARVSPVVIDGVRGPYRLWVDHRGAVLAMQTLFGIRWQRADFDVAVSDFGHQLADNGAAIRAAFPTLHALEAPQAPADTATSERRFIAEHRDSTRVDPALLAHLAGGRQRVSGDTIIVTASGQQSDARRADFSPDPMVQTEAAAIVAFAKPYAGAPANDATLRVMMQAIHHAVQLDTSALAPEDALGALAAHRGRADGIARLFVATARAAGMTARYVVGFAPRGAGLATHAWAEVWDPGERSSWYAVDPVRSLVPAPTDLIRLAYGGSSYPEDMVRLLANARFVPVRAPGAP